MTKKFFLSISKDTYDYVLKKFDVLKKDNPEYSMDLHYYSRNNSVALQVRGNFDGTLPLILYRDKPDEIRIGCSGNRTIKLKDIK